MKLFDKHFSFMDVNPGLHSLPRFIGIDQRPVFIAKEVKKLCQQHNINLIFSPVGIHKGSGLVNT